MTISAFSDELSQVRTKKKEFRSQTEQIVPWKEWLAMIRPRYYKGERGNKPYPLEVMLRLYLLQNLYDLSDEATVAEAVDSRGFSEQAIIRRLHKKFLGIYWSFIFLEYLCGVALKQTLNQRG